MVRYILSFSALILAVLSVRFFFRKSVPQRLIYALWLVVLVRICLPFSLFNIELVLPAREDMLQSVDSEALLPSDEEGLIDGYINIDKEQQSTSAAPPVSEQTPTENGTELTPIPTVPDRARFDLKTVLWIVWASGSLVFLTVAVIFAIRFGRELNRIRRYRTQERGISIYISDAIKTPCLYGIVPSVYIT